MKILEAHEALTMFAEARGLAIELLRPVGAVELLAEFYAEVRAEDAETGLGGASDFICVSWGTYEWNDDLFWLGMSRRLFVAGTDPDEADDGIWSLDIEFFYEPTPDTAALGSGGEECDDPVEAPRFRRLATELPVTRWCDQAEAVRHEVALRQDG